MNNPVRFPVTIRYSVRVAGVWKQIDRVFNKPSTLEKFMDEMENKCVHYEIHWTEKGMKKNPGTPKKGITTHMFQGRKFFYIGRTLYWNKVDQVKRELLGKGISVAVTKSKGAGFRIWASQYVHVPLMEVGGSDLFMQGEYNPKRRK